MQSVQWGSFLGDPGRKAVFQLRVSLHSQEVEAGEMGTDHYVLLVVLMLMCARYMKLKPALYGCKCVNVGGSGLSLLHSPFRLDVATRSPFHPFSFELPQVTKSIKVWPLYLNQHRHSFTDFFF